MDKEYLTRRLLHFFSFAMRIILTVQRRVIRHEETGIFRNFLTLNKFKFKKLK